MTNRSAPITPYQVHKAKWLGCTRCPLHLTRKQVVIARGSIPCDVFYVGEAPGESENVLGNPFVGPAGKLLDRIERQALELANIYSVRSLFSNLVGCIPLREGEKMEPKKESIEACAPRLVELVEMARPKLVVAVGTLSEKWLPTIFPESFWERVPLVPIIHPAAILRADISRRGVLFQQAAVTLSDAIRI